MKAISILLITMMFSVILVGQNKDKELKEIQVTPPKFTGIKNTIQVYQQENFSSFESYLQKHLKYPDKILRNGAEGTEVVQFEVSADGKLSRFSVINSVSPEIDAAIYNMLQTTCGMWKPGESNGKPVSMKKEISIEFKWKEFKELNKTKNFDALARFYMTKGTKQLLLKKNPQKALRFFNHGIKYRPNEDCLLMARGICKYELGDKTGAHNDWERMQISGITDEALSDLGKYKHLKGYNYLSFVVQPQ